MDMAQISIALSKGRIFDETAPLLERVGIRPKDDPERSRKLVLATNRRDVQLIVVRASDTPTYVERGGADLGVAGKDVLIEHAHVRDVAVVGVEDPQWGQAIVAVVVPAVGTDPDPEELREHVRKSLRGSRTPDRVVFRDELPTNATGKVLRREIVDELRAAPAE